MYADLNLIVTIWAAMAGCGPGLAANSKTLRYTGCLFGSRPAHVNENDMMYSCEIEWDVRNCGRPPLPYQPCRACCLPLPSHTSW